MPDIVAHGKRPDVRACSLCHYRTAAGVRRTPAAACPPRISCRRWPISWSDARKSADSRKANTNIMIAIAKGMTDEETGAAQYFSSMKWTPWIKVSKPTWCRKRASRRISQAGSRRDRADRPAHHRAPDDTEHTENLAIRIPDSPHTPVGSIKKGEALGQQAVAARRRSAASAMAPISTASVPSRDSRVAPPATPCGSSMTCSRARERACGATS